MALGLVDLRCYSNLLGTGPHASHQLTDLKYHWDSAGKYWHRAVLEEGFSFDALLAQSWVRHGIKVEVYDETGKLLNRL